MSRSRFGFFFLAPLIGLATVPLPAPAQIYFPGSAASTAAGNIEGFTVAGKGSAAAKPNRLEIDLEVSAASELTADAIVKYRDAKRRLQDAFTALKLEDVEVVERGLLVNEKGMQMNPYFFDYQPNRRAKAEVQLSRKLVVRCSKIRELDEEALLQLVGKLLDAAQDAGARVGSGPDMNYRYYYNPYEQMQSGLIRFILDDFDKLEEEAYEKAIADAQARAARLARLSRVELGPITAVRVAGAPEDTAPRPDEAATKKRLESSRFQEIPVRVELVVRFDVAAGPRPEGRAGDR
jgi:uncharacterized protein YggE